MIGVVATIVAVLVAGGLIGECLEVFHNQDLDGNQCPHIGCEGLPDLPPE